MKACIEFRVAAIRRLAEMPVCSRNRIRRKGGCRSAARAHRNSPADSGHSVVGVVSLSAPGRRARIVADGDSDEEFQGTTGMVRLRRFVPEVPMM